MKPRAYFNRHPQYVVGPIGIPEIGMRYRVSAGTIMRPSKDTIEVECMGLDDDALGVCYAVDYLNGLEEDARAKLGNVRTVRLNEDDNSRWAQAARKYIANTTAVNRGET